MPFAKHTTCSGCGRMAYCYGKSHDHLVCLECFGENEATAKLRRGGKPGKRATYKYQTRRPLSKSIADVVNLQAHGLVVGVIATRLKLSEKTVRNYLSVAAQSDS